MYYLLANWRWLIAIVTAQSVIFAFDVTTNADDVSIGFLYTLPTLMGFFIKERWLQILVTATSATLILFGCAIPIPSGDNLLVFVANRVLSILTVIISGVMVNYRCQLEQRLNQALTKEKQASAMQRAFVSLVSHEFRTPLTIIDGEAYRLVKLRNSIAAEDLETRALSIREAVARMVIQIDSVICASRSYEKEINIRHERVHIQSLVHSVCQEHNRSTMTHNIECHVSGLPVYVIGDKDLLKYVFYNLIGNAIKYSPENSTIIVNGRIENGMAAVAVKDYGIGVLTADLPHLFEPYYRGSNVAHISGSGIGLYIVDTFVREHGGRVEVSGVEGKGSTFTVFLPIGSTEGWASAHRRNHDPE